MKNILRTQLIDLRSKRLKSYEKSYSGLLESNFLNFIGQHDIKLIAVYYPLKSEVNLLSIILQARKKGYIVALPKIEEENSSLIFKRWDEGDELERGKFGVLEPGTENETIIPDLIISPLLGFDRRGYRLGYGGGYYDRTLERYSQVLKIALCYSFQEVEQIPTESHDLPLDYIITEKEIIKAHS